jgi:uncharacterized protein (TIGR02118 family)
MTVKLMVLYTQPEDPAAFDQHYFGTHMPLVHAMPGLQRAETAGFGTKAPYYRVAELYFADRDALRAACGSPEGAATSADYQQIAPEGSQILTAELDE